MTAALAAGVDAGKRYLDFGIEPSRKHFRVANAAAGIEDAITRLRGAGVRKVVLEAIGPFAHAAVKRLVAEGFEVDQSPSDQGIPRGGGQTRQDRPAGRTPDCALRCANDRRATPRAE